MSLAVITGTTTHETRKIWSVKDVYRVDQVEIPDGYLYVGFRLPSKGDTILSSLGDGVQVVYYVTGPPRIIVRKVPRKQYVFTERGTVPYKVGDWIGPVTLIEGEYAFLSKAIADGNNPYKAHMVYDVQIREVD